MCIGRFGVVTAQRRRSTAANWGRSSFRPSSARTAPFCVAITTATFPESRLFHACFFRVVLCARAAAGGFFSFVEATSRFLGSCEKLWLVSLPWN